MSSPYITIPATLFEYTRTTRQQVMFRHRKQAPREGKPAPIPLMLMQASDVLERVNLVEECVMLGTFSHVGFPWLV
jgi:hypothetical protein